MQFEIQEDIANFSLKLFPHLFFFLLTDGISSQNGAISIARRQTQSYFSINFPAVVYFSLNVKIVLHMQLKIAQIVTALLVVQCCNNTVVMAEQYVVQPTMSSLLFQIMLF